MPHPWLNIKPKDTEFEQHHNHPDNRHHISVDADHHPLFLIQIKMSRVLSTSIDLLQQFTQ